MKPVADAALAGNTEIRHAVVLRHSGLEVPMRAPGDIRWHDLTAAAAEAPPPRELPAEQPVLLMYTSGTTGLPKGTVHTHCGLGIKIGQDARLTLDLKPGDRLLWPTDSGWFGGTATIPGSLLAGATLVIAEGAPTHPDPGRMWRLIERHRVTHFGTAPTLARTLRREADALLDRHDLSSLRAIPSSGEAWDRETWLRVMGRIGRGRCAHPGLLRRDGDVRHRRLQHPFPAEASQLQRPGPRAPVATSWVPTAGACRRARSGSW